MRLAVLLAASLACVGIGFAKSAALSAHVKDLETKLSSICVERL